MCLPYALQVCRLSVNAGLFRATSGLKVAKAVDFEGEHSQLEHDVRVDADAVLRGRVVRSRRHVFRR